MHRVLTNNILLVSLPRCGSKSEDSRDGWTPSVGKRSHIKRLAFTELYLREVFGLSNLVETRGREKRQNLSNNLTKERRQQQNYFGGTTSKENTSDHAACLKAAQHNPQKTKRRRAEKTSGGPSRKNPKCHSGKNC